MNELNKLIKFENELKELQEKARYYLIRNQMKEWNNMVDLIHKKEREFYIG